jgi:glycerol-3-phosphate dehydrogenase
MKLAVLGSGNGGCAVAFDFAQHGHSVNLFDFESFPDRIQSVQEAGGIYAEGQLEGFAPIAYAGHDIQAALNDVEAIIAVGPAYSTGPFAEGVWNSRSGLVWHSTTRISLWPRPPHYLTLSVWSGRPPSRSS